MSRAAFRQSDVERLLRAARKTGAVVQVDIRALTITMVPGDAAIDSINKAAANLQSGGLAPDGEENW